MYVLGIESSCDETACAVVKNGYEILSNVIASQIHIHEPFGGVVPELACRYHVESIIPVIDQALQEAKIPLAQIDLIAVAHGPGLVGALLIGLNAAKALSLSIQKPFICVNHLEAHLYAALMSQTQKISFPCIGSVLSGGHTALVLMKTPSSFELIGETVDDAVGEAFDKVAKLLGLPYPGGPQIEKLAKSGDPKRFAFKSGQVKEQPFDFSFSGIKTAVLYAIKKHGILTDQDKADLAASFQWTALKGIVDKTLSAAKHYQVNTILFGGGVTNNKYLKELFQQTNPHLNYCWPSLGLSLDNGAMIAGFGYQRYRERGVGDEMDVEPLTRIPFAIKSGAF
jgi:N6-L-threonylcarbamoyladenine synthase